MVIDSKAKEARLRGFEDHFRVLALNPQAAKKTARTIAYTHQFYPRFQLTITENDGPK